MAAHTKANNFPRPFKTNASVVRSSVTAETIQIYHEDHPPPLPCKDENFTHNGQRKQTIPAKTAQLCRQKSLVDESTLPNSRNMNLLDDRNIYHDFNSYRHDSLFDESSFRGYLASLGCDSAETLRDTYCSSRTSGLTTSTRQSLLPPCPQRAFYHDSLYSGDSPFPPPRGPLPATPVCTDSSTRPTFGSPSKRSITLSQLELLRQSPIPNLCDEDCESTCSSPDSDMAFTYNRPEARSFSSTATTATSLTLGTLMTSPTSLSSASPPQAKDASFTTPHNGASSLAAHYKTRKPLRISSPDSSITMTRCGRTISAPIDFKSSSPISPDFHLSLTSHDFQARRPSPSPPGLEARISSAGVSSYTTSSNTPTTPSSVNPLLPPFQEQQRLASAEDDVQLEISAFDFDSDDGHRTPAAAALLKKISMPILRHARSRADTVPAGNLRSGARGIVLPKRISKQDIRIAAVAPNSLDPAPFPTPPLEGSLGHYRFGTPSLRPAPTSTGRPSACSSISATFSLGSAEPAQVTKASRWARKKRSSKISPSKNSTISAPLGLVKSPSDVSRSDCSSEAGNGSSLASLRKTPTVKGGARNGPQSTRSRPAKRVRGWFRRILRKRE